MLTITVPNWAKFNPRADRANYTWFRLQNDFFHDQAVFALSDSQRCLFLFLLCEASKKNRETVELLPSYIAAILGRREEDIVRDIEHLNARGVVTAESRQNDGEQPAFSLATNVRTNVRTNETNSGRAAPDRQDLPGALRACCETWEKTLDHLGAPRKCLAVEQTMIARAIREHGAEAVDLALYGAAFEPSVDTWHPKDHLDLARVLTKDKEGKPRIQRFVGFAVKERAKSQTKAVQEEAKKFQERLDQADVPSPEEVSRLLGRFSKRSRAGGAS
jgi:hypothetical protein